MLQMVEQTKEKSLDLNLKMYKDMEFGKIWGGLSYRQSLDGAEYVDNGSVKAQKLQMVTPIFGVNFQDYMLSYTYSRLMGAVNFDNGGFHQITLGMNLFCKPERYHCNCPAIN